MKDEATNSNNFGVRIAFEAKFRGTRSVRDENNWIIVENEMSPNSGSIKLRRLFELDHEDERSKECDHPGFLVVVVVVQSECWIGQKIVVIGEDWKKSDRGDWSDATQNNKQTTGTIH